MVIVGLNLKVYLLCLFRKFHYGIFIIVDTYKEVCKGCNESIDPTVPWVEAMQSAYHPKCFNCTVSLQAMFPLNIFTCL